MRRSARTTSTTRRTPRASSDCTGSRARSPPAWRPRGRMSQRADTHHMWGGRFALGPSEALDALNRSLPVDYRLWPQDVFASKAWVHALCRAVVTKATDGVDAILPGYTHGQRAQPVRWAYVLLAHAWPLVRDRQRLADARRRTAEMPLGSGALAGSGFPVDRVLLKEALGFRAISANALDATGDRDFVADVLFAIALTGAHLSRLGAELITYASGEFGFVTLADSFSTGPKLIPPKSNPRAVEVRPGKARPVARE